jgi:hypothetical protein
MLNKISVLLEEVEDIMDGMRKRNVALKFKG